jgi:hypothetical protein
MPVLRRNRDDRCGVKTRMPPEGSHVSFGQLRTSRCMGSCRLCAITGLMQCSKMHLYSITSSASASSFAGISRPSVFAVLKLITSSNLVGCTTGRSAGFSPLRMRPA